MPVQATCSECNKRIQAPDKFAGRSVDCPHCRTSVTFPQLSATVGKHPNPSTRPLPGRVAACSTCGTRHRLLRAEAQQVRCRDCRELFPVDSGELYPFGMVSDVAPQSLETPEAAAAPAAAPDADPTPSPAPVAGPAAAPAPLSSPSSPSSEPDPAPVAGTAADSVPRDPTGVVAPVVNVNPSDADVAAGLTALTPASVVAPVESAPVAEVKSPSDIHPPIVTSTPSPGAGNSVPIVTQDPGGSASHGNPVVSSDGAVPIQVGPPTASGGVPIEIHVDAKGSGPSEFATGAAGGGGAYKPVLRQLGPKKSMVGRSVEKDLKSRGSRLKASVRCKIGPDKSFRERIHHLGMFPEAAEMRVDDMMVLTIGDRGGDFRVVMPFDQGVACPVEFISVMPGRLPTSLGLLRGRGGNWGLAVSNSKPGSLLPQQFQSLMSAVGGQADAVWAVLDGDEPQSAAEILQQNRALQNDLRFDSKVKLGPMEVTYSINWIAQAMPLGPEQYLLVAKFIPRNRMMSMNFGAEWFVNWRDQFHRSIGKLPPGKGSFCCFDYGFIWGAVAQEIMGLKLL